MDVSGDISLLKPLLNLLSPCFLLSSAKAAMPSSEERGTDETIVFIFPEAGNPYYDTSWNN